MSPTWSWRMLDDTGGKVAAPAPAALDAPGDFSSQSDAETWLGEHWRELARAGVATVVLFEGARAASAPMSLLQPGDLHGTGI